MSALEDVLRPIAADIALIDPGHARLSSGESVAIGRPDAPAAGLTEILYARHYCRPGQPGRATNADDAAFFARLRAANPVPARADRPHEMRTDGHYFVLGRPVAEAMTGRQIRFYWNATPEGAPDLLRLLGAGLERRRIPFQLKVPVSVAGYDRADTGILYCLAEDVAAIVDIVQAAYDGLADGLRGDAPLFVRPLAPGLGFAESPPGGESFGQQRCRLLAEGLLAARAAGTAPVDGMRARLIGYGLEIDRLERNPMTCFPYDFSGFGG